MKFPIFTLVLFLAAGCTTTRSISDSGFPERNSHGPSCVVPPSTAFPYRGELNEFDVLGIEHGVMISDTEIERTLAGAKRVRVAAGSSILLVQSGATFPDGAMMTELGRHFRVVPFSGVPSEWGDSGGNAAKQTAGQFSKALRLAAARGGNDFVVCYWGVIESASETLPGRTISWIPVVNWMTPDERQHMRLRLKIATVDVRTGDWAVMSPAPVDASRLSISPRRRVTDQKLVENLKATAYRSAVMELIQQYGDLAAVK